MPGPVGAYLRILADALTSCALFAIGLGLSIEGLRANFGRAAMLTVVKLVAMPLIVFGLAVALRLEPLYLIAAVICGAVPTAKTVYILAGEYHREEPLVAATVSMTTLWSIGTLILWMHALAEFGLRRRSGLGTVADAVGLGPGVDPRLSAELSQLATAGRSPLPLSAPGAQFTPSRMA